MLDAMEASTQHDESDQDRGRGDGEVPTYPGELEAGGDAGKLSTRGARVGHHQGARDQQRRAAPVGGTNERHQALACGQAEPRAELVEDDERPNGKEQGPQERVAVPRSGDRIRRDSGRIVV